MDGDVAYFGAGVFPHEMVYLCAANAKRWNGACGEMTRSAKRMPAGTICRRKGICLPMRRLCLFPPVDRCRSRFPKSDGDILFQKKYSWRTDAGGVVGGTKAVLGDGQIFAGGPHHFLAMDQPAAKWVRLTSRGGRWCLADEVAYILTGENLICVNRAEHTKASQEKQKWFLRAREVGGDREKLEEAKRMMKEFSEKGIIWQYPTDFDDVLVATGEMVVAGGDDRLDRRGSGNREEIWKQEVNGNVRGVAIDDGMMIVSTDEGNLYAFGPVADPPRVVKHWPAPYSQPFPKMN